MAEGWAETWSADTPGPIKAALKRGMSDKKALAHPMCLLVLTGPQVHEVEALATLIAATARRCGADQVLDFGAGQVRALYEERTAGYRCACQGYLSQVLHYRFGLNVTAVDNQPVQTSGCTKRNATIEAAAKKCSADIPKASMKVVQSHIQATQHPAPSTQHSG